VSRLAVFGYSEVGYRCLKALLDDGADIAWVVTHRDNPAETRWFGSVADLATSAGLRMSLYEALEPDECLATLRSLSPDFLFSFYFRHLLSAEVLATARRGALNMHGSLLPAYRGRAPVNWAIIRGEARTGASLHYMTARPDAGDLVDQEPVPIGVDDTGLDVSLKVAEAAARIMHRTLPALIAGTAGRRPQDLARGSCFPGRTAADGRIDFSQRAWDVHNLIRAVAPPFPGAFGEFAGMRLELTGSRWVDEPAARPDLAPRLYGAGGRLYLDCADGRRLLITRAALGGAPLDAAALAARGGELRISVRAVRAGAQAS
jgi:methionyl-tRNA formyltransferase